MWLCRGRSRPPSGTCGGNLLAPGDYCVRMASPPAHKHTNRLINETSPYLLQHAHNPVDWWPWGDEAFAEARRLGKPVFLSIGYSTCHWCHVMEEESFEDEEIAAAMNDLYVSIKVDREERPDVDAIYMSAVQALTGSGGWPMSVWLTPEREPFFGGTYFPPRDGARGARHGFLTVLRDVHDAYVADPRPRRARHRGAGRRGPRAHGGAARSRPAAQAAPSPSLIGDTVTVFKRLFDERDGGLRRAPKFPSNMPIRLLLRAHARTSDDAALLMAALTLEKMAAGGMYDQLGGRLPPLLHRRALAGAPLREDALRQRAAGRRLRRGAPGHRPRRLRARRARHARLPAARDGRARGRLLFRDRRGLQAPRRKIGGRRLLRLVGGGDPAGAGRRARDRTLHPPLRRDRGGKLRGREHPGRRRARRGRARRARAPAGRAVRGAGASGSPPFRDDKILAAWNGLAISAAAVAGRILDEPRYIDAAARAATFLLERMRPGGRLARSAKDGRAGAAGFLDDYAFVVRRTDRSLRGDVRSALAARGARARRRRSSACSRIPPAAGS